MPPRKIVAPVVSALRGDGALSVVEVSEGQCVMSTGEVLLVKWDRLKALCEALCQERAAIWIRTWMTPAGNELIEAHRLGESSTDDSTATPSDTSDGAF